MLFRSKERGIPKRRKFRKAKLPADTIKKEPKGPKAVPKQTPPTELMTLANTYIGTYLTRLTHPCRSSRPPCTGRRQASTGNRLERGSNKTKRSRRRPDRDTVGEIPRAAARPSNLTHPSTTSAVHQLCRAGRRLLVASERPQRI